MKDDNSVPDLPSDDELGITEDDIKAWEAEQAGDTPPASVTAVEEQDPLGETTDPPKVPPGAAEPPKAPAAPAPAGGFRGPITLGVLFLIAVLSLGWRAMPSPVPANAPADEFSSSRAMANLVEVAREAHPPGSPEHDRVRDYLVRRLQSMGVEPTIQETTSMLRGGELLRAATVRNIVARVPGTASTGAILVTAHYDSRELSRGAGDDGVGVVTILETIRALQGSPLRNDLIILITDAEELGLLGARAFVDQHPLMQEVTLAISIEMRGGGGPSIMFETGSDGGWMVERYAASASAPVANSLTADVYRRLPNDTDFTPFRDAGVQGLNFAGIGRANIYHQAYDAPENVSEATIQHHGDQLLSVLQLVGNEELGVVDAPDLVYFSVPFFGLATYPGSWAFPLGMLVALFAVAAVLSAMARGARISGILVGFGISIVIGALTYGAGLGLMAWLPRFHPEMGALHAGAFHSEGWYVLALLGLVFFLVTGLFGIARGRFGLGELGLGAAVIPVAAALAATFAVPLGAMNLQWPVMAGLMSVAVLSGVGPGQRPGILTWLVSIILAIPAVIFLAPVIELLWVALSLDVAGALGVLVAIGFFIVLPVLDVMREPNRWWAPVLGLAALAAFIGVGIVAARPSDERPTPSTLVYALDRETGQAVWGTQPVFGDDAEADPARAWAVNRAGNDFGEAQPMDAFHPYSADLLTAPATAYPVPPFAAVVTAVSTGPLPPPRSGMGAPAAGDSSGTGGQALDTQAAGPSQAVRRTVRVGLRSALGAEVMTVWLPDGASSTVVAVNGHPIDAAFVRDGAAAQPRIIEHWGRPDSMVYVDFQVPPTATELMMDVVEQKYRGDGIVPAGTFDRPPGLAPNVRLNSDRAWIRTPVRLRLTPGATNAWSPATAADTLDGVAPVLESPDTVGAPSDSGLELPVTDSTAAPVLAPDALIPDTLISDTLISDTIPAAQPPQADRR